MPPKGTRNSSVKTLPKPFHRPKSLPERDWDITECNKKNDSQSKITLPLDFQLILIGRH